MSHFRRWSPSGSGTARGGESSAKADCISESVSGMSRRTKARPARLYRERKVALVDVCAVGDVCIEIGAASCVECAPTLRGICGTNEFFATVVAVAVGIGLGGRDGGQDSAGRAPANHFTWTGLFTHVTAEIYTPTYLPANNVEVDFVSSTLSYAVNLSCITQGMLAGRPTQCLCQSKMHLLYFGYSNAKGSRPYL